MTIRFRYKSWVGAAAIGTASLSPAADADASEVTIRYDVPSYEQAIRVELSEGLFEASELNIVHVIPGILRSEATFHFFLENPDLYLELRGIDPGTVNLDTLVEGVEDLLDRYDWWDPELDFSRYFASKKNSQTDAFMKTNFKNNAIKSSKTNTGQLTKFNEIEMQDMLAQQARGTIRMYLDRVDFMPLITPELVQRIVR